VAFAISPAALDTHAATLTKLSESVAKADTYAADHLTIGLVDTSFLFATVIGDCETILKSVQLLQKDLASALSESAVELTGTAQRSRDLDDELEAQLDGAYPGTVSPDAPQTNPSNRSVYMVPNAPEGTLAVPEKNGKADLVGDILGTDWLSPSAMLMEVIKWATEGWDPVSEVSKFFSGDWNTLYTFESALANLGRYHRSQGDNIGYAMSVTASSWEGEASDAANVFFTNMTAVARASGDDLVRIAPEFSIVARGMETAAENVGGLLTTAMDAMLVAAVLYAAGIATSATGVGAIVGAAGGSAALVTAIVALDKAWDAISGVMSIIEVLSMTIETFSTYDPSQGGYIKPVPYNNPTVD
jgi:hypothetical protein